MVASGEGLLLAHAAGDGDPARVLPIYTRLSMPRKTSASVLVLPRVRRAELRALPMSSCRSSSAVPSHGRGGCRGRERVGSCLL